METGQERYQRYINSSAWSARRRVAIQRQGRKCRACHSQDEIQVHHRTYERLEHEDHEDLVVLCASCHSALHQFQRKTLIPLEKATDRFLAESRRRMEIEGPSSRPSPIALPRGSRTAWMRRIIKQQLKENEIADLRDHTPSGWLPAHLRPENQGRDWRDERRSFNQPK